MGTVTVSERTTADFFKGSAAWLENWELGVGGSLNRGARRRPMTIDQALIAILITAMNANEHVAPEEAARAQHIIWSTRRFRRQSGDVIGRLIEEIRDRIEDEGEPAVIRQAARAIPARLRPSAFAVAADTVLVDTTLDREERRFLVNLATELDVGREHAQEILRVMLIKNGI